MDCGAASCDLRYGRSETESGQSVEDRELVVGRLCHVVYVGERSEYAAACVLSGRFFFFFSLSFCFFFVSRSGDGVVPYVRTEAFT